MSRFGQLMRTIKNSSQLEQTPPSMFKTSAVSLTAVDIVVVLLWLQTPLLTCETILLCGALPQHVAAALAKSSECARDHVHTDAPTRADPRHGVGP